MSLSVLGKCFIDGAQFTTDPRIRREWPPRRVRLKGIMGSVTQQDWRRWAQDMRLTLESFEPGNFINHDFKAHLDGLLFTQGASYSYSDYQGIEATVVVASFDPVATFYRDDSVDDGGCLWAYALVLDVMSLAKLDFHTYSGS